MNFGLIRDENGKISSTRVVLLTVTVIFAIASITDVFYDVQIDSYIYNVIQTIYGIGLGSYAVRTSIKNYNEPAILKNEESNKIN